MSAAASLPRNDGDRVWYFDWLRLFGMLAVIFLHAASSLLNAGVTVGWHAANVIATLCYTAVPLFFMMSGYLLLSGERTADLSLLWKRRLPKLLLPLLFWSVVAVAVMAFEAGLHQSPTSLKEAVLDLLSGLYQPVYVHLWYVYTLLVFYVLSPLLYRMVHALDQKSERYLLGLIGVIVLLNLIVGALPETLAPYFRIHLTEQLRLIGGHMISFLLGYYLGKTRRQIPVWLTAGLALLLWGVIAAGTWIYTAETGSYGSRFFAQGGSYVQLLAACLFLLAKRLLNHPRRRKTFSPVVLSLPIYLMHNLLLKCFWLMGLRPTRFLHLPGICLLTFLVCFLVTKTLSTIPGLCRFSCGLRYREACRSCNWIYTWRRLVRRGSTEYLE